MPVDPAADPAEVGQWSDVFEWPIIGIHSALTPDGKILTFGTDQNGIQSGLHIYDIWDPITNTHTTLEHTTHSDLFCSVAIIDPSTQTILIAGGDARPTGGFNDGINDVNVYNPADDSLTASPTGPMNFARWYGSAVSLGNGESMLIGGRSTTDEQGVIHFSAYPEIYTPGYGFRVLTGAYIDTFNLTSLYPRSWLTSKGNVWTSSDGTGKIYSIDPHGVGSVTLVGDMPTAISWYQPSIMFDEDKVLLIGNDGSAWIMDLSGDVPTFVRTADVGPGRIWSNLVVLPDGRVMISGGSDVYNELEGVSYAAETWDPKTGQWSIEADANIARLYHSTTILLEDGRILSLGGGAPGPLTNTNGEIYSPDYLFADDGSLAARPLIEDAPSSVHAGDTFTIHVDNPQDLASLALMPFGSVTHSFDMTARRFELDFTVMPDGSIQVVLPTNTNLVTPGDWMLFAINSAGTPSVASTLEIVNDNLYDLPQQRPMDLEDLGGALYRNNDAAYDAYNDVYVLTPDAPQKSGSFMSQTRIDMGQAFSIAFEFNVGNNDAGADGLGFVLHNDPKGKAAVGDAGGGLGLMGIQNGIGIEFDTFANVGDADDIANDHTNFDSTGTYSAITPAVDLGNIEDGNWHQVTVTWDGVALSYTVDGVAVGTLDATTVLAELGGSQYAYFGFTGGTGGLTEQTQVRLLSVAATLEDGEAVSIDRADLPVPPAFALNGDAQLATADRTYDVTANAEAETGSVMSTGRIDVSKEFNIIFDLNFGADDAGADGMGFVLHNDVRGAAAIGDGGGGMGLLGIANGLGIEFDTYQNAGDVNDIAADHTDFVATQTQQVLTTVTGVPNLEDGHWHRVQVTSDGDVISYLLDGEQIAQLTEAEAATIIGSNFAYFGVTGATGGLSEQHSVRMVKLSATAEDGTALQIVGPNSNPVTVDDFYTMTANGTLVVDAANGVLANDSDPDGDPLTVCLDSIVRHDVLLGVADHGTITFADDGSFVYTPNTGFIGTDTIYYGTEDGPACTTGQISIEVTAVTPVMESNGSAVADAAPNAFIVTPDAALQAGSVMSQSRIDLGQAFDLRFEFNVGNNDNGADGMGFVLHNDPRGSAAIGDLGGGMGMLGIALGLGIEFDTYQNADDANDIANDHTSFYATGTHTGISPVTDLGNVEDGNWHPVHVSWDGETLTYSVDGVVAGSLSKEQVLATIGGTPYAYFGFTGATGGLSETEQVRLLSMTATGEDGTKYVFGTTDVTDILGDANDNTLTGTDGPDRIAGLAGADTLTGGLGNDIFAFDPNWGTWADVITDFSSVAGNRDTIDLSAMGFDSGAEALSYAQAVGADTLFDFGGGHTLLVKNTAAGNVSNLIKTDITV